MLDLSTEIASPAGFQNNGMQRPSIGYVNGLLEIECNSPYYDHEFMEVSGCDL